VTGWLVEQKSGRRFQLKHGDTQVGRSRDNDVVFTDPTVSRHHLVIRQEESRFIIHDRGSTSGTYVNGHRLEHPALLAGGEAILIGETQLRFVKSAARRSSSETPTRRM
jgi:pSer/pThr/pTyr-binding forkhead associated (FHA) protein